MVFFLSFSPVLRKCIADLKNGLEDNLTKMFQENLHSLISQTPVPVQKDNCLTSTIRQELKTIMKELLFERSTLKNAEKENNIPNASSNANTRCQLVSILLHT